MQTLFMYIYIYMYMFRGNVTKKRCSNSWYWRRKKFDLAAYPPVPAGYSTAVVWIFIYFVQCRNLMNRKCNYPDPASSPSPLRRHGESHPGRVGAAAAAGLYDRVVRSAVKIRVNAQNDTMLNRIIIIRMFTHVYRYYCFTRYFNDTQMKMIPAGRFQHRGGSSANNFFPRFDNR